jgi:hypothetical protein
MDKPSGLIKLHDFTKPMMHDSLRDEVEPRTNEAAEQLLKSSWIDHLTDWIGGLPGPSWLAYLILFIILGLLAQVGFWVSGIQTPGSFGFNSFLNQLWIIEVLFFNYLLDQDARRALNDFRPLMDASNDDFARSMYEFTNLPARPVLYLTLIGIPVGLYLAFPSESPFRGDVPSVLVLVAVIGTSLIFVFAYRIIRQLRTVSRLYAQAQAVDLYDLDPIYALSSHTAKTGLILLVAVYSNILITPEALEVSSLLFLVVLLTLLASAAFLVPLRGINRRLVREKKKLLQLTQNRIKSAFKQVELSYDDHELGEISTLNTAVLALQNQKAFIEKIPTWPWQASTLRGFITVVLLPLFIWAIQQVLSRLFDL